MISKLTRNANGSFVSSKIHIDNQKKVPSSRFCHCAWEHGEKMWVFGGFGPSPVDYLNDHGDFVPWGASGGTTYGNNNQLFSFDPTARTWTNAECFGDIPSPRGEASTAIVEDTVWLYGGSTNKIIFNNDLHELNMLSFTWTKIETTMPRPNGTRTASLTPISANQLVLYGGYVCDENDTVTWVFNVQSHTWRQHPTAGSHRKVLHTGITGLNSSVIILGGETSEGSQHQRENTIISVILEPKCLQQLAIQVIYKHRSELPWESLPKQLTCKIMDPKQNNKTFQAKKKKKKKKDSLALCTDYVEEHRNMTPQELCNN